MPDARCPLSVKRRLLSAGMRIGRLSRTASPRGAAPVSTRTPRCTLLLAVLLACTGSLPAAVVIAQIRPDKMIYPPNAPAVLKIELNNTAGVAASVTVVFALLSELDHQEEIARQAVTLGPKESTSMSLAWNTGRRDYGHGALVSVLDTNGTTVLDSKEEPFSITDNVWKVALDNQACYFGYSIYPKTFNDMPDGAQVKYIRAGFDDHSYYANYFELNGWAPDDLFELAPAGNATEMWRSGTYGYLMTRKYAREVIQAAHDAGLQIVTYLQPFTMGRRSARDVPQAP